ncbi:MAG: 50S ribosomal protein L6 [Chloroflexi bacterium]|nr:50S ribosomal protein L6 [Chloroflexota bacterium]MDA1296445.1 50S ribosomal protein L6 [Chloroflexota bacterium]
MSRIGLAPITVPSGVEVKIGPESVSVKGKLGELNRAIALTIDVKLADGVITVSRRNDEPKSRSLHGLTRSLVNNMVVGVSDGFEKRLRLVGTGYRVQQRGKGLEMSLGFSHPVLVDPLGTNRLTADGQTTVVIAGPDKELVGEQAARIRKIRKPNAYSGKGVIYENEVVRRKAGKAAGGKGA